ncbi:MAG: amidohydrolase family protein [Burkholderiaceae bacterium]|nr:amidohydrolase family protein [Burkholderiaceae bacterium]
MRGVAVIDESISDAELHRLDRAGVRGVRFNVLFKGGTPLAKARSIAQRIRPLGWHVQLLIDVSAQAALYEDWKDFPVPVVVDHMGHLDARLGVAHPGFQALLRLLAEDRCWVKLSGAYRMSALGHPNDGDLVDGVPDWLPTAALQTQVLVHNPARLYGFD